MKQNVITISLCFILMMVLSLYAITVTATTGEATEDTSSQGTSSEVSSEETSSDGSSSDDGDGEENSSEEQTSSEEASSEEDTSSAEGTTSNEETSSSDTTSKPKPSKPSGGTFIDETGSVVSLPQTESETDESGEGTVYEDEDMGVEEEIEHYEGGKVVTMSSLVTRYMWIPILISLLCIASLIYVNITFKAKYATGKNVSGNRRPRRKATQKTTVNRRRVK